MILKVSTELPDNPEAKVIKYQISKSGTSIGANNREANRSKSKADFVNKIRISEGKASKTVYWLEKIQDMNWISNFELQPTLNECKELLAIFTSTYNKTKHKQA